MEIFRRDMSAKDLHRLGKVHVGEDVEGEIWAVMVLTARENAAAA